MTSAEPLAPQVGVLDDDVRGLLRTLGGRRWSADFYLAGSAGLALYLDHRPVGGLDLMGWNRLVSAERRDLLQDLLTFDPGVRVETARDGLLYVRFSGPRARGLRLYHYPYPLIDTEEEVEGLSLASALDLGLMKLGAVISRGGRRDFVDLYLLTRRLPLATLLARSGEKFGHVRDFPLQALKGLADLEAARDEPMPRADGVTWSQIESWVHGEVRQLAREWTGLTEPAG
ncbi:MAG: hypothetical protein AAGD06_01385 [Acidobacteriota bacterium]